MAARKQRERKDATQASPGPVAERPPRRLMMTGLGLWAWLAVPWIIILGTTLQGQVVFAVCLVFSLIAIGISGITVVQALRSRPVRRQRPASGGAGTAAGRQLTTGSGKLPMKAAALQILLIPGSLALGFTALAIIDVVVRT